MSDPQRPRGLQPTRLLHPWDFLGKSTGLGCHCLLPYHGYPRVSLQLAGFPHSSVSKECACNAGDLASVPCWEDPLEKEMATHSGVLAWRIPMDRGAWWAPVHGVAKSQTQLSDFHVCSQVSRRETHIPNMAQRVKFCLQCCGSDNILLSWNVESSGHFMSCALCCFF